MKGFSIVGNAVVDVMQGIGAFALDSIKIGAQFEQMEIAMSSMLGSVGAGKAMMTSLQEFAKSTPFELGEISGAAKQLIAYGTAQDQVVPTMRMLGDIASGLSIPLSELTYLYGTAAVQGRLFTRDLNQMTSRGIDVVGMMAQQMGKTKSEILSMTEQGKISFSHMQAALVAMTSSGGIFEGMMSRQVNSVAGAWSNLSDVVTIIKARIGQAFSESLDLSGLMQGLAGFGEAVATAIIPRVQQLAAWLSQLDFKALGRDAFDFGVATLTVFGHIVDAATGFIAQMATGFSRLFRMQAGAAATMASVGVPGMSKLADASIVAYKAMEKVTMQEGLDVSAAVQSMTDDIASAMEDQVVWKFSAVGEVAGEAMAAGVKSGGGMSGIGSWLMSGISGAMGGVKSIWNKMNAPMEEVAREVKDARFADFGGDAISAAARESHNLRFRKDQGEAEPKKQTSLLKKIHERLTEIDTLNVVDVA
jgi:tape measure domain-containing protein